MKIFPPSELANAAISEASDSALRMSALNWRVLSSPRAIIDNSSFDFMPPSLIPYQTSYSHSNDRHATVGDHFFCTDHGKTAIYK